MDNPHQPPTVDPMTDTTEMAVIAVPGNAQIVGGALRPPRPLTVGRRRSDRWLFRMLMIFIAASLVFVLYTAYAQATVLRSLDDITMCRRTQ